MSAWRLLTGQFVFPEERNCHQAPPGSKPITELLRWLVKAPNNTTTGRRIGRTSFRIPPQEVNDKKGV